MAGVRVSNFAGFGSKRLIVCLVIVLIAGPINPASAQSWIDWRKSTPPPEPTTHKMANPLSGQTLTSSRLSLLDESTLLLPLVFSQVQADPPVIKNGNFELGGNGDWTETWVQVNFIITSADLPLTPHSGQWVAWLGGVDSEVNRLYQSVSLAPSAPAYLHFFYQTHSDETSCTNDLANITANNVMIYTFSLCNSTNTSAWQPVTLDLSSYAGQAVDISFNLTSNESVWSSVVIDDVTLSLTP